MVVVAVDPRACAQQRVDHAQPACPCGCGQGTVQVGIGSLFTPRRQRSRHSHTRKQVCFKRW
jgi:hypothetical protein